MYFQKKRVIAMLLAGGQGSRLKVLTEKTAKPAVPFGGKYRIIDFPLSNCVNSGTVVSAAVSSGTVSSVGTVVASVSGGVASVAAVVSSGAASIVACRMHLYEKNAADTSATATITVRQAIFIYRIIGILLQGDKGFFLLHILFQRVLGNAQSICNGSGIADGAFLRQHQGVAALPCPAPEIQQSRVGKGGVG